MAELPLEVDSSQVAAAAVDLDRLAQAAIEAGSAADRLAGSSRTAASATEVVDAELRSAAAAASAHAAAMTNVVQREQQASAAMVETGRQTVLMTQNMHGLRFATANVAAQLQDIVVTSQMGMNAWTIALQQGTQISAALSAQGGGLASVGRTIGAAFASIVSPLSLITIGVVGFGSMALQALGNVLKGTDDANDALEKHEKWLREILVGYKSAAEAAQKAVDEVKKLPQGVVSSDLTDKLNEQRSAVDALDERIQSYNETLRANARLLEEFKNSDQAQGTDLTGVEGFQKQLNDLANLGITAHSSTVEIEAAMVATRELQNSADDPALAKMAGDVYNLLLGLRDMRGEVDSTTAALNHLNDVGNINISLSFQKSTDDTLGFIEDINRLAPDTRTKTQQVQDALEKARAAAYNLPSGLQQTFLGAAEQAAARATKAINDQKAAQDALRHSSSGGGGESPQDKWNTDLAALTQRIDKQELEVSLVGKTTYEINKQRTAFDLLNRAKTDGVSISDSVRENIDSEASAYAAATARLERLTQAHRDETSISNAEQDAVSSIIKTWIHGGNVLDTISNKLGSIADMLVDMAVRNLFAAAFGGAMGVPTGGIFGAFGGGGVGKGGLLGGMLIPGILHDGGEVGRDGYGHSRAYPASAWFGAPRFHNGTNFASDEFPAILQRGERVVPRDGGSSGGTISVSIDVGVVNGNLVPLIRGVSGEVAGMKVQQATPAILSAANKSAPAALASYRREQRGDWREQ